MIVLYLVMMTPIMVLIYMIMCGIPVAQLLLRERHSDAEAVDVPQIVRADSGKKTRESDCGGSEVATSPGDPSALASDPPVF